MLGPPKTCRLDQPVTVSLEALVPPDHFYRFLDAKLDLTFVRTWVQDRYAERGRPSIDPVVFFKLQLIMFFEVRPVPPKPGDRGMAGRGQPLQLGIRRQVESLAPAATRDSMPPTVATGHQSVKRGQNRIRRESAAPTPGASG